MKKTIIEQVSYTLLIFLVLFCTNLNAQAWEPICTFDQNNNNIRAYELFPDTVTDQLYIGGLFNIINGDTMGNITAFDGNQFHFMTDSMNACWNGGCNGVVSIIRYQNEIVASLMRSSTYEARPQIVGLGLWNGIKWQPLDGGIASFYNSTIQYYYPSTLYDFCVSDNTLYVAGSFQIVDSVSATGMASWDGAKWNTYTMPPIPPGSGLLSTSIAKYKGNIYLGGNFIATVDGQQTNDLIRFDGTSWHKVGDDLVDGWMNLHDMEVFQDKLYVAGYFSKADGNPGNSIMSWDGEKWDDLGGGACSPFGVIDDLFVYKDKLYVAGGFDCISGIEVNNVATWDGEKWCRIGNSVFNRAIHGVAVWRDTVYVAGSFFEVDGVPLRFLARYIGDHSNDTCSAPVSAAPEPAKTCFKLSPNPTSDLLEIQAPSPIELVWIYDAMGRAVLQPGVFGLRASVSVGNLPAGLYFVSVRAGGKSWSGKFVRQ